MIEEMPHTIQECSLKHLDVSKCPQLGRLTVPGNGSNSPLHLPRLEKLVMDNCPKLTEVCMTAPKLREWIANNNPILSKVHLSISLNTVIQIVGSPQVDLKESVKASLPLFFEGQLSKGFYLAVGSYLFHSIQDDEDTSSDLLIKKKFAELLQDQVSIPFESEDCDDFSHISWKPSDLNEELKALITLLPQTSITGMKLEDHPLREAGVRALTKNLPQAGITQLSLFPNEIPTGGMEALAAALPNTKITLLAIETPFTPTLEARKMPNASTQGQVKPGSTPVRRGEPEKPVSVLKNSVEASHWDPFFSGGWVDLQQKRIGDKEAATIAALLPQKEHRRIYLDCNDIGDAGAIA